MVQPVKTNKGVTLIELMVVLIITLIMMLGVYGMLTITMQENIESLLREEAIRIAEEILNQIRALPFDKIQPDGTWTDDEFQAVLGYPSTDPDPDKLNPPLDRSFRGFIVHYTPVIKVTSYGTKPDLKEVEVTIRWQYRDFTKTHTTRTIIRNPKDV
jgi:prepilin-type N-terminal cleavage/methylation domain-containing protein